MNKNNDPTEKELEEFKEKYAELIKENAKEESSEPKSIIGRLRAWSKKIAENLIIKF